MLNKERTGNYIDSKIVEYGFSKQEVADYLGLNTPRVIYDYIDGEKMPSLERLILLSELFNCLVDDMLK